MQTYTLHEPCPLFKIKILLQYMEETSRIFASGVLQLYVALHILAITNKYRYGLSIVLYVATH